MMHHTRPRSMQELVDLHSGCISREILSMRTSTSKSKRRSSPVPGSLSATRARSPNRAITS